MNSDSEMVVVVEGLIKQFAGPESPTVTAVNDVSFELPRGKMIVIKGPSGCGKSTLLNLIGALEKPTAGSIVVDGINVPEISGRDEVMYRLQKVGFVSQYCYLVPNLAALENVMLPMDLLGVERKSQKERARRLLERVGIDVHRQASPVARLPAGEQQRVAIARALTSAPAVILADEPTSKLDLGTSRPIVELLQGLTREGETVILATHEVDIAAKADIVLEMTDGRIRQASPSAN